MGVLLAPSTVGAQPFVTEFTVPTAAARPPIGGAAFFDGADIGAALLPCLVFGTRLVGGQTVRCPGLTGGLLGPGFHTMAVTLVLSDGSTVGDTVTWQVQPNTEP